MIKVDTWTPIICLKAHGKKIKAIAKDWGLSRNTVRKAIRSNKPPKYHRPPPYTVKLGGKLTKIRVFRLMISISLCKLK